MTWPGWLGQAQPTWAELDPAPKIKIKNEEIEIVHVLENKK
jgi:hypothetical protein